MIRQLKPIGTFSERKAREYLKRGLLFLIPCAFLLLTSVPLLPIYMNWGIFEINRGTLIGVFATLGGIFIMLPYRTYKSGLNGERKVVKNISDKLSHDYSIFNDVLLKDGKRSGNVDHIIVGPTGIFVVETKNNEGTITFDGYCWKGISGSPSGQAVSNMFRVKDVLKDCEVFRSKDLYVNAVVLFTNDKVNLKVSNDPKWCKVLQIRKLTDSHLSDYIKSESIRFSEKEIASIEQNLEARIGNYDE